jgi:hypothetical protein
MTAFVLQQSPELGLVERSDAVFDLAQSQPVVVGTGRSVLSSVPWPWRDEVMIVLLTAELSVWSSVCLLPVSVRVPRQPELIAARGANCRGVAWTA